MFAEFGPRLNRPAGLALGPNGDIYVAEWGAGQVVRLSGDGVERARLAMQGSRAGQLNGPVHVALAPTGEVYVADWGNDRVQRRKTEYSNDPRPTFATYGPRNRAEFLALRRWQGDVP